MFLYWMVLVLCVTSVLSRSTSASRRDAIATNSITSDRDNHPDVSINRHRREITSHPSNIFWIRGVQTFNNPGKIHAKDVNYDHKNGKFNKSFKIKYHQRIKRESPSTDAVIDDPASQWLKKSPPKTNFITAREHRTDKTKEVTEEDSKEPQIKTNEIPDLSFRQRSDSNRPIVNNYRDHREGERPQSPSRRIIYYADLPDVTSKPREHPVSQRRYEPVPLKSKYARESSVDENIARSKPVSVDRYRYRPASQTNSYTIIDSEAPQPNDRRGYPARSSYYQEAPDTKYTRIPMPYRQNDLIRNTGPGYDNYPRNQDNYPRNQESYTRNQENYPRNQESYQRNPNTYTTSRNNYPKNQENYPRNPDNYPRNPDNNDYPRNREPVLNSGIVSPVRSEPYRDYNPRQPAPWSVQIGTKLTVKDDGRPFRREDDRSLKQDEGRRFYVSSQDRPANRYQADDRTRYRLL